MVELRPLIIVSGTLHVEGGLSKSTRVSKKADTTKVVTTEERTVSKDRRAGNVVAASYMRRMAVLKILRTPWGALVGPEEIDKLKAMVAQASAEVTSFNKLHTKCKLANTMVYEPLEGPRREAISAWVARKAREGDEEVKTALALLTTSQDGAAA